MKNLFLNIIKSEIFRNTSILVSGTVLAQLVPILLQPVIRRFFTPEEFGAYAIYLSIVGILVAFTSFSYDLAIVLPLRKKETINIVGLTVMISFFVNLCIALIIIIWKDRLSNLVGLSSNYSLILYAVPLGTFLLSINQNFYLFLVQSKAFVSASFNKLIRRIIEGASQIIMGFSKFPLGLVFSDILGNSFNAIAVLYQSYRSGFKLRWIKRIQLVRVSKQYSDFPKINLLPSVMSACSSLLPAIIINRTYSTEYAGFFDLSKLLLSIPLALVATSLSNVLLQRISFKFQRKESVLADLNPILVVLSIIAVLEIVVIVLFGETIFQYAFGEPWITSGRISKILVWSYSLNFVLSSFTTVFIAFRRLKWFSLWQILYFCSIISLFFFKSLVFDDFIKLLVFLEVMCYMLLGLFMLIVLSKYEKSLKN